MHMLFVRAHRCKYRHVHLQKCLRVLMTVRREFVKDACVHIMKTALIVSILRFFMNALFSGIPWNRGMRWVWARLAPQQLRSNEGGASKTKRNLWAFRCDAFCTRSWINGQVPLRTRERRYTPFWKTIGSTNIQLTMCTSRSRSCCYSLCKVVVFVSGAPLRWN